MIEGQTRHGEQGRFLNARAGRREKKTHSGVKEVKSRVLEVPTRISPNLGGQALVDMGGKAMGAGEQELVGNEVQEREPHPRSASTRGGWREGTGFVRRSVGGEARREQL